MRTTLGQHIRKQRKALKLSRDDLAGLAGVSRNFIVKVETGKGSIVLDKLIKLITPLGLEFNLRPGKKGIVIE